MHTWTARLERLSALHWMRMVFAAALFVALTAAALLPEQTSTDYQRYYAPRARDLLAGTGLLDETGRVYDRYPPGYPLLLALVFGAADALGVPASRAVMGVSALGLAASAALLYALAESVFGKTRALLAAGAWMVYPFALWSASGGQIEAVFAPVFFAAALAAFYGRGALAGLLIGLAMLIRPAALAVGALLALWLLVRGRRRAALVLIMINWLVVLPWLLYVYRYNGVLIPLSTGGMPSVIDGVTFAVRPSTEREAVTLPADVIALQRRIYDGVRAAPTAPLAVIAAELRADPAAAAQLALIKAARAWYATDSRRFEALAALIQAGAGILISAAAWRIARGRAPSLARPLLGLVLLLTAYSWATTIAVLSILRYMLPSMGLLFCLLPALTYSRNTARSAAMSASVSPAAVRR